MFEVENIDIKEEPVSNVVISEYFIAYSVCVLLNVCLLLSPVFSFTMHYIDSIAVTDYWDLLLVITRALLLFLSNDHM